MQQFQHALLHLVGLSQRGDARLVKDGVLGHVGHFLSDVSGANAVFGSRQVLGLVLHDVDGALQPVDGRADLASSGCYGRDGRVDVGQGRLGQHSAGERRHTSAAADQGSTAEGVRRIRGGGGNRTASVP